MLLKLVDFHLYVVFAIIITLRVKFKISTSFAQNVNNSHVFYVNFNQEKNYKTNYTFCQNFVKMSILINRT